MKQIIIAVFAIVATIILMAFSFISTPPATALQTTITPTISSYLPLVSRDYPPTPTSTPTPTATATHTPTATSTPTATPKPAVCGCSGDLYNCTDFPSHTAAQACYDYCVSLGRGDIHKLDQDGDGIACESLPGGCE
jgi:hypothetical protein